MRPTMASATRYDLQTLELLLSASSSAFFLLTMYFSDQCKRFEFKKELPLYSGAAHHFHLQRQRALLFPRR